MKRNAKKTVVVIALIALMAIPSMMAYFTDTDSETNTFTVGEVEIDLTEPTWDATKAEKVTPNLVLPKDPKVTNNGVNDAFVFVTVEVPFVNAVVANDAGVKQPATDVQLFSWTEDSNWALVDKKTNTDSYTYIYAYTAGGTEMNALANSATTSSVFSTVQFANFIENDAIEKVTDTIEVKAYAIQTTDITEGDVTSPKAVWNVVNAQHVLNQEVL